MYPFPITFWAGGARTISVRSHGVVYDELSIQTIPRLAVKSISDTIMGMESLTVAKAVEIALTRAGYVLDEIQREAIPRVVSKAIEDILQGTAEVLLSGTREIDTSSTGFITDLVTRQVTPRAVSKVIEDLLSGSENVGQQRDGLSLTVQEMGEIVDNLTRNAIPRLQARLIEDLLSGAETITISAELAPPSSLTVTPVSTSRLDLSWTNNTPGADGFQIWHSTNGSSYTLLTTLTTTTYSHTGLSEASQHWYRVRAYKNVAGTVYYSNWSSPVNARTATAVPNAPSSVNFARLTSNPSDAATWVNRVTWSDNSTNETNFRVRRSVNGGSFVDRSTAVGPNVTSYDDSPVTELTQYSYRVRSRRTVNGQTAESSDATSPTQRTWAMSPSGLSGSATSPTSVHLSWTNHSNASHVRIYRGGSLLTTVANTGPAAPQSAPVAALPGTVNPYEVRAYDSATGQESIPNAVQTTVNTPVAPPSVSATDVSYCTGGNVGTPRVYLSIAAGADDPAWRLRIRRNLDSPAGWQVVADNLPIGTKEWYDEDGVLFGNGALYEVEQYRSGYPTSSAQTAKLTNIGQGVCPGDVTGTGASGASICEGAGQVAWASHLTWTPQSGWSVRIERARNAAFTSGHGTVGVFSSAVDEIWDDDLPSGGLYYYRWRYERTVAGKTSYGPWTSRSVDLVTPCPPSLTGSNYARASITPCPITQEVHCVGWDLIDPAPGYYIRIRRRINGGSWTIVSDQDSGLSNIPLTAATCVPPGTTYGVAVTPLLYGDGPNNHTDNVQYEITVRDAGGSVHSTSLTANYGQSHSFC